MSTIIRIDPKTEIVATTNGERDVVLILRPEFHDALKVLAESEGFDDVAEFTLWFLSLWGGQLARYKHGDEATAETLMEANVIRWPLRECDMI